MTEASNDIFLGITERWARADMLSLPGEHQIRSYFSLNRGPRKEFDLLVGVWGSSRSLVLTNRRLILVSTLSRFNDGKVSWEVPLDSIQEVKVTLGVLPAPWFEIPISYLWRLMTRRLELIYLEGGSRKRIRFHVPEPRAWVAAIKEAMGR